MKNLPCVYNSIQMNLFPVLEEEIGELSAKMQEFVRLMEIICPSRYITLGMRWCEFGRPMKNREYMLRAFFLKAVYCMATTKVLIENLRTNPSLRRLCGWEYRNQVPSEATFSRAFNVFAEMNLNDEIHKNLITEQYTDKIVGHASIDSTAIIGREKACRKNTPKSKTKKKRGRKSKAEKEALAKEEIAQIQTRRLELQSFRTLEENLADLPQGCDWSGKRNSKGKTEYWCGYKMHLDVADGGVPLAAITTSASVHDSQVAIPLLQMSSERAIIFYDLADSAYDAKEIKDFSNNLGHVAIIDPNPRRGDLIPLAPAKKIRFKERTTVERTNSDLKDNYGGRNVRVKGQLKVHLHLMFGIIAITVKQLFNMLN